VDVRVVVALQVLRVNGAEVLNLAHLKRLIKGPGGKANGAEPAAGSLAAAATAAGGDSDGGYINSSIAGQVDSPNGSSSETAPCSTATSSSSSDVGMTSKEDGVGGSSSGGSENGLFSPEWDEKFIRLELEDDRVIIMERAAADAATERLQRRYRVPYLCSADLAD
jgi:hypothetical protein